MESMRPKPRFVSSSVREKAADKNGPHRLVFSMRPNKKYYEERALGTTDLFPFSPGSK
jgi:hypothetical protein